MLSAVSFALSLYAYHAARVVVPVLVFGPLIIYRDILIKQIGNLLLVGLIGLVALTPLMNDFLKPDVRVKQ